MGMGLALIGGALQGIGSGMYEVGKMNAMDRYAAMQEERKQRNEESRLRLAGQINDENDANKQFRSATYDKASDERAAGAQVEVAKVRNAGAISLEEVEQKNKVAFAKLETDLGIKRDNNKAALDFKNDLTKARILVDRVERTDDGYLIAYNATGDVIKRSSAPLFSPKGSGGDDDPLGLRDDASPAARRPAAAPAEEPAAPAVRSDPVALTADINRLAREYAAATPETHPGLFRNGRKLSLEEATEMIRQSHGGD